MVRSNRRMVGTFVEHSLPLLIGALIGVGHIG